MNRRVVGKRVRPIDWEAKTTGREPYATDVRLDGLLVGAFLRSPHAHARIVRIDTSRAEAIPGVHAVVTVAHIPGERLYIHSGGALRDRPQLADGVVRYIGEEVAAVAAVDRETAQAALDAIRVKYKKLRPVMRVEDALDPGSRPIHDRAAGHNIAFHDARSLGDLDAAHVASASVQSGRYVYPRVGHAPMETNATTASWDPDSQRMHIWTSSQSPWFVAEEIANALQIPQDHVICHDVSTGGGFGSKSHVSEQEVIAALLSLKANRPVVLALSRKEEFAATKPRHEFQMELSLHSDQAQRICLIEAKVDADNGAYNHYGPSVLMGGLRKIASMYAPDAVSWDGRLVDTTLPPGGQFRGYGSTQTVFALESAVDELAHKLRRDPLDFRIQNANSPNSVSVSGSKIGSARLKECLEIVRREIDWDNKRAHGRRPMRGLGVAAAMHGSGAYVYDDANRSDMMFKLQPTGDLVVTFGGADAGTGQRTVIAQIVAEETGIPLAQVHVTMNSSEVFDLGAWSSRGTHMSGHAARQGAQQVGAKLREAAAAKIACSPDDVTLADGRAAAKGDAIPIGDLAGPLANGAEAFCHQTSYVDPRMERLDGANPTANYSASYSFAAHAMEVEVDPDTGKIRVLDYVAAHDVGRPINPTFVEGQIAGGAIQGLGAAMGERILYEDGRVVNPSFLNYSLFRSADAPRVRPFLAEGDEEAGPYSAKSVGEIPILPPGPAFANAVFDAIGVRFRELPITPDMVLEALRDKRPGHQRRRILFRPARWEVEVLRRLYPYGVKAILRRASRFSKRSTRAPRAQVVSPTTVAAVLTAAAEPDSMVLAGGTDILPRRDQTLVAPKTLISIAQVRSLRELRVVDADGTLQIGAGVTLADLIKRSELVPSILAETAREIATPGIRELATVGGNLLQAKRCWFYRNDFNCYKRGGWTCPCYAVMGDHRYQHAAIGAHRCQAVTPSDLASSLLVLDAVVEYERPSGEVSTLPVGRLYSGPGESRLPDDAVMTAVRIDREARERVGVFRKLSLWHGDFAVTAVAFSFDGRTGRVRDPRVVVGSMAPVPMRLERVERELEGVALATLPYVGDDAMQRELARVAHPLPRNGWKVDATAGIFRQALQEVHAQSR